MISQSDTKKTGRAADKNEHLLSSRDTLASAVNSLAVFPIPKDQTTVEALHAAQAEQALGSGR